MIKWAHDHKKLKVKDGASSSEGMVFSRGSGRNFLFLVHRIDRGVIHLRKEYLNYSFEKSTWFGAVAYCNYRSEMEGLVPCYCFKKTGVVFEINADGYRLPTEAEWEYAARGGVEEIPTRYSGSDHLDEVGWFDSDDLRKREAGDFSSRYQSHGVGEKKPNELGLFDMSGNSFEWCHDWYGEYVSGSQANPLGADEAKMKKDRCRVQRGGYWRSPPQNCRISTRSKGHPEESYAGFRVVRSIFPRAEAEE